MSAWDKEGINERTRELVEGGWPFAHVAKTINAEFGTTFSRSAIIGRCSRNGIAQKHDNPRKRGPQPRRPRGIDGGLQRRIRAEPVLRAEPVVIVDDDIPVEQRKTLFELTGQTCRWPVGEGAEMFFCGAIPVECRPYCAGHMARAFTKMERPPNLFVARRRAA